MKEFCLVFYHAEGVFVLTINYIGQKLKLLNIMIKIYSDFFSEYSNPSGFSGLSGKGRLSSTCL